MRSKEHITGIPWLRFNLGLVAIMLVISLPAQQSTFTKVYYDNQGSAQAYATVHAPDHGFCVAGEKDAKPLAMRIDSLGEIVWARTMCDESGTFYSVCTTPDSCMVFAGYAYDWTNIVSNHYFVKTTLGGDTLWTKTIAMESLYEKIFSISSTNDGGFIAAGESPVDIPPFSYGVLIKLDAYGELEWGRLISANESATSLFSVRQMSDSGYVATGMCDMDLMGDEGKMIMLKMNRDGEVDWSNVVTAGPDPITGLDVVADSAEMTWLFSAHSNGMGLMRTDDQGNPQWIRIYGYSSIPGYYFHSAPKLSVTSDEGFVFVDGGNYGPGYGVKIDHEGNPVLNASLFLNTIGVLESDDGGFVFSGNGPILGVEMTGTDNPQIGWIKTDEQFNAATCVYPESLYSDNISLNVTPATITTITSGTIVHYIRTASEAYLSTDFGCVAFIGDIHPGSGDEKYIQIFPNPSEGLVHFQATSGASDLKILRLDVINSTGAVVLSLSEPGCHADLSSCPDGLYIIRMETKSGTQTQRIILLR